MILRITDVKTAEAHNEDANPDELERNKGRAQIVNLLTMDTGNVASLAIQIWNITNNMVDREFYSRAYIVPAC